MSDVTKKTLYYGVGVVFMLVCFALGVLLVNVSADKIAGNMSCVKKTYPAEVQGDSLEGIISSGASVHIYEGFYDCNEVQRGDVVAYNYAGNKNPIIKIIYAIPGDYWFVSERSTGTTVYINNVKAIARNGSEFIFLGKRSDMLSLYAREYPIIPPRTYLLFGTIQTGSLDSSRFGLVDQKDIIGKVAF